MKPVFEPFKNRIWLSSPTMHGPELEYVSEAYHTNWMSTVGENINEAERIACEKIGCEYAVGLSAGTAALHMAIKLAGVKPGDKVLIVGAGTYGVVAYEIVAEMGCFEKIDFVDDEKKTTPNGIEVIGTVRDLDELAIKYSNIIVAIGNPGVRLTLLKWIKKETPFYIVTLVSLRAYISSSVQIMCGCIILAGCIISAGAVVNHISACCAGVHIHCNEVVAGIALYRREQKYVAGKYTAGKMRCRWRSCFSICRNRSQW